MWRAASPGAKSRVRSYIHSGKLETVYTARDEGAFLTINGGGGLMKRKERHSQRDTRGSLSPSSRWNVSGVL